MFFNTRGVVDEISTEIEGKDHYLNITAVTQPSELEYNAHTYFRRALERRLTDPDFTILCIDGITATVIGNLHRSKNPNDRSKIEFMCTSLFETAVEAKGGVYKTITDKSEIITPVNRHDRNLELAMAA